MLILVKKWKAKCMQRPVDFFPKLATMVDGLQVETVLRHGQSKRTSIGSSESEDMPSTAVNDFCSNHQPKCCHGQQYEKLRELRCVAEPTEK